MPASPDIATLLERAEEIAGIGSCTWSAQSSEMLCSPNFRRLLGLEHDEPVTVDVLLARVHPDDRPRVAQALQGARSEPAESRIELRAVRPDGTISHLQATAVVEQGSSGRRRVVTTIQDMTGRLSTARKPAVDAGRSDELAAPALTAREVEILQLAADGHSGPEIARALAVSYGTVKTYFARIYVKLRSPDRTAAIVRAMRYGLIE